MKRLAFLIAMTAGLSSAAFSGVPVQDMSSACIGVDYSGVWRGAEITALKVPARESAHHVNVRYAPLPYFMLSVGFGAANYTVDTCNDVHFKGGFNFSPSLGANLFSPFFLNKTLRVTAGVKSHFFYTRNSDKSFLYYAPVVVPNAGLIVSLGDHIDLEAGVRGFFLFGHMQEGDENARVFSNNNNKRAYLSLTLHTPVEGAYVQFDFDASENIGINWSEGPAESSLGISVGFILRQPKDTTGRQMKENADYPGFKEMQKKIEEMDKSMR